MKLEFTSDALDDLATIELKGLLDFGAAQTSSYLSKIEHSISLLVDNPHMARERDDTLRPVRMQPVGAHLVVYEIIEDWIRIVRVLHSRQNWKEHL